MNSFEKYVLNDEMQEMPLGEGEGTVLYDPETENTYVLDDVAQDIIDMFRIPSSISDVVARLVEIYDATEEVISKDVTDFVDNAINNNILVPENTLVV